MSCSLKAAALAFSSLRMLPVIQGFWLGYVRTITVGTMSSMHLLMKPLTEVVYSSMPLDESRNIFQSVLAKSPVVKQPWHLWHLTASVLSESLVLPALVFACKQGSGDIIMVRFAKWRARELSCLLMVLYSSLSAMKRDKHRHRYTHIHKHTNAHSTHTYTWIFVLCDMW